MNHQPGKGRRALIVPAVLAFLLVFVLSFLTLFFIEREVRSSRIQELKNQEIRVVELVNEFIGREFNRMLSDLQYLHYAYQDELQEPANYPAIARNWVAFATQKGIYDQIRYLDLNGDERIRVNLKDGAGNIVPQNELQNKKDRYYFDKTISLPEGSIYVSPLDLNIENTWVEEPYKPMMRLAAPVYDQKGEVRGIVMLNYLADYTLRRFRDLAANSQGEIILLNADGYRLSSQDPAKDWNFMFEDRAGDTFSREYPEEWAAILHGQRQLTSGHGLFTASQAMMSYYFSTGETGLPKRNVVMGDERWYIVSLFARSEGNRGLFEDSFFGLVGGVFARNLYYFVLIAVVAVVVGYLVYLNRKANATMRFYSEHDPLTRAYNRRSGIRKVNALIPADNRRRFLFSLCYVDVNGLKEINDTLGHNVGDELIVMVAGIIQRTIRAQDLLIRLGGDEFLIVFPGIPALAAEAAWQRITQACERANREGGKPYLISLSHGIADFDNLAKVPVEDMIDAVDRKMYEEKALMKPGQAFIKPGAEPSGS